MSLMHDGNKKSDRNAKGLTTNVFKYLYWCDAHNLDGDHLTRTEQVKTYMSELEKKLGSSTLQQKYTTLRLPFILT